MGSEKGIIAAEKHCYCKITQRAIERLLNYASYIEAKLLDESEI